MSGTSAVLQGLDDAEAATRLAHDGPNELPREPPREIWKVVWEVLREPMFRLLVAAGLVYLLLGDLAEALLLLFFIFLSVMITVVQQVRTDRALEALRDLSSPRALVLRAGQARRIASRELVRGDILIVAEGDRVPADAVLREAHLLQADESLLTGESHAVVKAAAPAGTAEQPQHRIFAGTLVVTGRALAEVSATGADCEMGRIGTLLRTIEPTPTPLANQIRRLVRLVATLGLGLSAIVVLIHGLSYGDWLAALLAGIALAMALLPEEFPVVLTVFLALGARRLAVDQVLTRRPDTIEALGAASVLCTDKTGTLTRNRMAVAALSLPEGRGTWHAGESLTPALENLLACATGACADPPTDPMEQALAALSPPAAERSCLHAYPLSPELWVMGNAWADPRGCRVMLKGAPEAIAQLCGLSEAADKAMHAGIATLAAQGLRVLAVAEAVCEETPPPSRIESLAPHLLGLVGFADPLRETVPEAIRECRTAGIRVLMVTGDYPATAQAIARQAGLAEQPAVLTGDEIEALSEAELDAALERVSICARVSPRHKLRIVQALRRAGAVVGMTGDGVNDAPALRAAHIGIAMGGRGTDVAREAASLVLLDDDFSSIVTAVRLGRRINDNLGKALAYIVAVHIPIAGLVLLPLMLGWPLLLGPLHIVFMELVVDPICSIVFEAEPGESSLMQRPPRPAQTPIFSLRTLAWSLCQGSATLVMLLVLEFLLAHFATPEAEIRTLLFVGLIAGNLVLLAVNRRFSARLSEIWRRPNPAQWPVLSAIALLVCGVLFVPAVSAVFGFVVPAPSSVGLLVALSALLLAGLMLAKPWFRATAGAGEVPTGSS